MVACSDYSFGQQSPEIPDAPPEEETDVIDVEEDAPPPPEECNGVDDDGDGEIDEGFPDTDGDGVKDCLDEDCEVEIAVGDVIDIDTECVVPDVEVSDPWNVAIEWQWTGMNVIMTPVVGNLTDDDGDGDIDADDTPDVAFVAFSGSRIGVGTLVVLDGATGSEHYRVSGWNGGGGVAIGDVDADGVPDIIGFDEKGRVTAVTGSTGASLWTSERAVASAYPQATVVDIDGDGAAEVLADNLLIGGSSGAVQYTFPVSASLRYRLPAVGDIDLDGVQEVILGNVVYDPTTGLVEWSSDIVGRYGHWSAILDSDGDPEGEVAMVASGRLAIYDSDGTELVNVSAGAARPGPPCVADFDGDGAAEIAWASNSLMNVYELDGTSLWSQAVDDSSGLAACSGYDVNGDGAYEVIYADQFALRIFDGTSGTVRYEQSGHASATLWEYPAIADLDNDGSAEIVMGSNHYHYGGWDGITVFGHAGDGWLKSGTSWQIHDFAISNINPDCSVPASPTPSWQLYNVYRARPAVDDAATDLQIGVTDVCYSGCADDSYVAIAVQVRNGGSTDAASGVSVSLYAVDGETHTLVETQQISSVVPVGTSLDGLLFETTRGALGVDGFAVTVDDDGTGSGSQVECDEANNVVLYLDTPCD